ncbi:MAG: hypothetical protein ACREFX_09640 [Opitutaceae bacterium]
MAESLCARLIAEVALPDAEGRPVAATFSGSRGIKDVEILECAAEAAGLRVRRD